MPDIRPSCFGIPENCMPRDENGIIQPQENCSLCDYLRDCLHTAVAACGGVDEIKSNTSPAAEESEQPGSIVGAILRWSERKRAAQRGKTTDRRRSPEA